MEEFYINVELSRGMIRLQVVEVPPGQWDMPNTPQFIIKFCNGLKFVTLSLLLENGTWHDLGYLHQSPLKLIGSFTGACSSRNHVTRH